MRSLTLARTATLVLMLFMAGCASLGHGLGEGQSCGGVAGLQCQAKLYCAYTPRSCHADQAEGRCTARPQICPQISQPICGCDGKTYANTCVAAQNGVSPARDGVCGDLHKFSWF